MLMLKGCVQPAMAPSIDAATARVLDRLGPRRTFSAILAFAAVPCFLFATAQSFEQLIASRLLMGVVGAGFVVGIRMVSEWFPPSEVGTAEGIYGGWGNFGAAAAALTLPAP